MVTGIIQWVIISTILILLIHHLFFFLKNTLTVPKVKDLVHKPSHLYKEIEETLVASNENNTIKLSSINNNNQSINNNNQSINNPDQNTNNIDPKEMKNELKNFFNEINQNKSNKTVDGNPSFGSFPQMNEFSKNMYSEL